MAVRRCMSISCATSLPIYILGYGVFLVSFVCANWVQCDLDESRYAYGLWWNCTTIADEHVCRFYEIDALEDSWLTAQAFYLIALVLCFLAGTMYPIVPVNALFQSISGASALISSTVFATAVALQDDEKYDYAFYLGFLSGIILLVNGLMLLVCVRKDHCTLEDIPLPSKSEAKGSFDP
ncbi:hypothetical protein CAPTEDRAFT_205276 [Capitella teleta]|uniref:Claudin n=1 Tax=Capitella teleta TaxID=283909 RepID=R7VE19_CAPTE|nr:hypothetical protein CAPTEDRAFT_205276 [Capitella teleta]|eukprot:ELU16807.1 hypothetical protein CAPTEDRAFT_205276 [Capitella teleta]